MASSSLCLHKGAIEVPRDQLAAIDAPPPAGRWYPLKHSAVLDTVRQISGVAVTETVPDTVLDLADEIILVDLTPEQLSARLAEGKVYLGERAEWAAKNFFRESNLTALREMALRLVAEHVDRDLRDIMSEEKIAGPWKSGDRLLVAVSASPYSERLIRYTRRLAASMEASWIVANIEQPRPLSQEEQTRLTRYLALARQLGAEVISTPGTDIDHGRKHIVHHPDLIGRHYLSRAGLGVLIEHLPVDGRDLGDDISDDAIAAI